MAFSFAFGGGFGSRPDWPHSHLGKLGPNRPRPLNGLRLESGFNIWANTSTSYFAVKYLECDVDGGLLLVDLERFPVPLGRVAHDDVGLALAVGLGDADGVLEGLAAVAVHHDLVLVRGDQSERKRRPGLGLIRR